MKRNEDGNPDPTQNHNLLPRVLKNYYSHLLNNERTTGDDENQYVKSRRNQSPTIRKRTNREEKHHCWTEPYQTTVSLPKKIFKKTTDATVDSTALLPSQQNCHYKH